MKKNKSIKVNFLLVIGITIAFLACIVKLSYVNLSTYVDGIDLRSFADNRNTTKKTLYATRGAIYDANGDYLAQTVNSYTLIAYLAESRTTNPNNPQHVVDKVNTAKKLSEVFLQNGIKSMSYDYILERLKVEGKYQVEFGNGGKELSEVVKAQIDSLNLPGIDFMTSSKRYYQMGDFASYVVGYVRRNDEGKTSGEMGIERYYNNELTGSDGYTEYQTDNYGYKLPNASENTKEAVSGSNIFLTLDNNIQLFVEHEISELKKKYKYSWITFNVMDAKSGAILASTSSPSFDANKLNITNYLNPLVSYQYEPGSTMKIFSFMAAIEDGIYDGSKIFKSGNIKVDDATIKDFNTVGWGNITYDQGFANSSNVAATNLGLELGKDKLTDYYKKFGFGKKTGINLPDEVNGTINFNYRTEIATAAFGQGITTTPIQNLQALTTLANDGIMLKPYIIDKIVDTNSDSVIYEGKREEVGRIVSKETTDKMRELMSLVMTDGVTDAKFYKPSSVEIIGKTGTAQIANPNGKGYLVGDNDFIKSFTALFPKEDPQYIIYTSIKQLNGSIRGLANAVANVIDEIAKYKSLVDVVVDDNDSNIFVLDKFINNDVVNVKKVLDSYNVNYYVIGDGNVVINQYPLNDTKILNDSKLFIITNSSIITMPNVIGWSRSEIITYCNLIGLKYNISGSGRVKDVSIKENDIIDLNSILEIKLG